MKIIASSNFSHYPNKTLCGRHTSKGWNAFADTAELSLLLWDQIISMVSDSKNSKANREGSVACHLSFQVESFMSPIVRSEEIDISNGNLWCHTALNTRRWWALILCDGSLPLYLISNRCILGSAEPEAIYSPSEDQFWSIRDDWESVLSCCHPSAWSSDRCVLISNKRSCFSGVLIKVHHQN